MTDKKTELKWCFAPFDHMTQDELLLNSKRMYAALVSLNSVLGLTCAGRDSGFWGKDGSGGIALEQGRQTLDVIHSQYSSEDIYRSYFRYAVDLLFERNGYCIGFDWAVCPKCNQMAGAGRGGVSLVGKVCGDTVLTRDCTGVLRKIEWSDLDTKEQS